MSNSLKIIEGDLSPLPKDILVTDMEQGDRRTLGGVILLDDNSFSDHNIKPRWCKVYKVGTEVNEKDIVPGKWVLVEHGRWSYGMKFNVNGEEKYIQKVEAKSILMVSDENPGEERL